MNYNNVFDCYNLLRSSSLTTDDVVKCSNNNDWRIRYYVARKPKCPIHILEKLSLDDTFEVRIGVKYNNHSCTPNLKTAVESLNYIILSVPLTELAH